MTFLFTDVEGSTRLWEEDPAAMKRALARHDEIIRATIEKHDGYVFTTAGDAFSAAFTAPRAAAEAALEAQGLLHSEDWDAPGPIRVRMAVHTGTAEERDGDYFGPALNRCARLLGIGHGGQVLVSLASQQVAGQDLPDGSSLVDLGQHRLKDLSEPERVFQLVGDDDLGEFLPLNSIDAFPHNLPQQLTSFIGRDAQLREVTKLIGEQRLLTLTGVGGSGKTRLALQAAAEVVDQFRDGAWLVELAAVSDTKLVPHVVASAVGATVSGKSVIETLEDFLEHRQLLLVMDNCEHLLGQIARLADQLLRKSPGLHILSTSREGLGIAGERLWQVPSLEVGDEWETEVDWELASEWEAVRLFYDRAVDVQPAFALTEDAVSDVVGICRRLDGMPLAIELAAARTRMLSVDQIAQRIHDRFRLLTGGSRTALPRQQTLLATVEWSYELLTDAERVLFDRLAVFRGGFTLEAAEAVCIGDGLEETEILELLSRFLDRSLIQTKSDPSGAERFTMLETLRHYSRQRLAERGEADVVRRQHAHYFLAFAEDASPRLETSAMVEWLDRLETEHDNLRAALSWMLDADQGVDALRMTVALSVWFWFIHRHHEEALDWHEKALRTSQDVPPELLADAMAYTSMQAMRVERTGDRAEKLAREVLELPAERRHPRTETVAHGTLADVAMRRDYDDSTARFHFEEALRLADAQRDDVWVSRLCLFLYLMHSTTVSGPEARKYAERAVETGERVAWPMGLAEGLGALAGVELEAGNLDRAEQLAARSLEIEEALDDPWGIGDASSTLGAVARMRGDHEQTADQARRALSNARRSGDRLTMAQSLLDLSAANLRLSRIEEATTEISEALMIVRDLPYKYLPAKILAAAACIIASRGGATLAVRLFGSAERLFSETGIAPNTWDRSEYEKYTLEGRQQLGPEDFQEAWQEGNDLVLPAAVDLARKHLAATSTR